MKKLIKRIKVISVLDAVIIIGLVFAVITFFFFYSRKPAVIYVSTMNNFQDWPEYTPPSPYWISNTVQVGDKSRDSFGGERAEVIGIDNAEWGGERRFLRLRLKVNALYNKKTNIYLMEDQPLLIGNRLSLDIGKIHYEGIISYVGTTPEDLNSGYKWAEVDYYAQKLFPWIATAYNTNFTVKNTTGETIFKILSANIEPALQQVNTADGRVLLRRDPFLKDVHFTARVKVRCELETCYYNDVYPIRIGAQYTYFANEAVLSGHVKAFRILDSN